MPCRCALIQSGPGGICDYCLAGLKKERDDARQLLDEIVSRAEAVPGDEELYNFTKWLNEEVVKLRNAVPRVKPTPFAEVMVSRYIQRVNRGPFENPAYVDTVHAWTECGQFEMGYDLWFNLFGVELENGTERKLVKIPAHIETK